MRVGLAVLVLVAVAATAKKAAAQDGVFYAKFEVANLDGQPGDDHKGSFVMEIHTDWAPLGVARMKELLETDFFSGVRFFRVIDNFMAQFGISGKPSVAEEWRSKSITDDPVKESNKRGFVSFATSGQDSRTTQMFINFRDNTNLDGMGFSPFAKVVSGMDVVDRIFKVGERPNQGMIQSRGNAYLKKDFPQLTYITKASIVDGPDNDL